MLENYETYIIAIVIGGLAGEGYRSLSSLEKDVDASLRFEGAMAEGGRRWCEGMEGEGMSVRLKRRDVKNGSHFLLRWIWRE